MDPVTSPSRHRQAADEKAHAKASPRRSRRRELDNAENLRDRVYRFSDLSRYSFRDRMLIRIADLILSSLIVLTCSTLRWEVRGRENLDAILTSGHRPILASWHACILSATWFWRNRGIVVMSSVSRDAEYTGRAIKRFGYGTARGSATRGGGRALAEMAQCLDNGIEVGFTIDGPRGPAYVAKTGALTLARHTGQAILPFHTEVRRYVEFPSWDRSHVPLPFTAAICLIGEPIYVPRHATSDELIALQARVQSELDDLRSEAETWRTGA